VKVLQGAMSKLSKQNSDIEDIELRWIWVLEGMGGISKKRLTNSRRRYCSQRLLDLDFSCEAVLRLRKSLLSDSFDDWCANSPF